MRAESGKGRLIAFRLADPIQGLYSTLSLNERSDMANRIASALLFLALAPTVYAAEIADDTPARGITLTKADGDFNRIIIAPGVVSMKECREALETNAEDLKAEDVLAIFCVPADMTKDERFTGSIPFMDLAQ